MKPTTTTRRAERGFTLVEALAAVAVGSIVVAALTTFYLTQQRAFLRERQQIQTSQQLRIALDQIVRDLRIAGRNPTSNTTNEIGLEYAAANEVRFRADLNGDEDWTDTPATDPTIPMKEVLGFRRSGSVIETYDYGAVDPWPDLAEGVDPATTLFRYYTGDPGPNYTANEITSLPTSSWAVLSTVKYVVVTVAVRGRDPGMATDYVRTQSATVKLRNAS